MIRFASKKHLIVTFIIAVFVIFIVSVTAAAPNINGEYDLFRVSVGTGDVEGDGSSFHAFTNYDGRYVAFESYAQNWAYDGPGTMLNYADIFLRDTQAATLTKLSVGLVGGTADEKSFFPSLSFDGRYIAYLSYARNLVPNDTNGDNVWEDDGLDVFLYDQMFGTTQRISLNHAGQQIEGESIGILSGDGRFLIFVSNGANVMPAPTTDGVTYMYIRDWQNNTIGRITQTIDGEEPEGLIHQIAADYDAELIAFSSDVDNLVPNDTNNVQDIFLYNRLTGLTSLITNAPGGAAANDVSGRPQLSPGGEYLVFSSYASNLVPGDTNGMEDIFLYEVATGTIRRISLTYNGLEANGFNKEPTICENGRYIAWTSEATNLVPGDFNGFRDIFFYDMVQDVVRMASREMDGTQGNANTHRSWLSPDCRWVVFASEADNIVPSDNNQERDLFMGRLIWPFDLSTSTAGGPAFAEPGDTLTYQIWVRNSGLETNTASLIVPIPENTTFVSGSGTNGAVYNSALNRVEWSGSVSGESVEEVTFSVLVDPGLTETVFLALQAQITGDNIGYTLESLTIVNGYYAVLPAVNKN